MANENLIRLIEQTPDIKKRFKTEYISFGKPAGKPAIQTPLDITVRQSRQSGVARATCPD